MKLKDLLNKTLNKKELALLPSSYDVVGDILIFSDFPEELQKKEKKIGVTILGQFKNIKVVCKKTKKYSGRFRLPKLKIISGERRKETEHKENNIRLKLNVEKVYFSPRSCTERKRISGLVRKGEDILVMFSGCCPYPINIAKNTSAKHISAVEMNPIAHEYALENLRLNKIKNIDLFLGDAREILPNLDKAFDRIIMPLPKGAIAFLDIALTKIKKKGTIHLYTFLDKKDINKTFFRDYLKKYCSNFKIMDIVRCGQFSPGTYRVCVDIKIL